MVDDESNDRTDRKFLVILARYFDVEAGKVDIQELHSRKYLRGFPKAQTIGETPDVKNMQFEDKANQLDDDLLAIGQQTYAFIAESEDDLDVFWGRNIHIVFSFCNDSFK